MLKVSFLVYEYLYYLDQDNPKAAFEAITRTEQHLDNYPVAQKKEIQKELLFAYSFLQPNPEKATAIYQEIETRLSSSQATDRYRAQAAYALFIQQNNKVAQELLHKAALVVEKSMMKSFIPLEKKLLAQLKKQADAAVLQEA